MATETKESIHAIHTNAGNRNGAGHVPGFSWTNTNSLLIFTSSVISGVAIIDSLLRLCVFARGKIFYCNGQCSLSHTGVQPAGSGGSSPSRIQQFSGP